jgi:hypothetical protein
MNDEQGMMNVEVMIQRTTNIPVKGERTAAGRHAFQHLHLLRRIMTEIGFHASHEQFPPSQLLALSQQAAAAGFDVISCSDHFFSLE